MKEKKNIPGQEAHLRKRAERIAQEKAASSSGNLETLSPEEMRRILHELQVHQIELELQNEELRRTQAGTGNRTVTLFRSLRPGAGGLLHAE